MKSKTIRIIITLTFVVSFGTYCWVTRNDAYQRGYRAATGFNTPAEYQAYINTLVSKHIDSLIAKKVK